MTPQYLTALDSANAVRSERRELRDAIKAGESLLIDLLNSPPKVILRMAVYTLLQWEPGIGPHRARQILRQLKMDPGVKLYQLAPPRIGELRLAVNAMPRGYRW